MTNAPSPKRSPRPRGEGTTRAREGPPRVGELPSGPLDALTDVPGVMVGHATIAEGPLQTGVTMIVPHPGWLERLEHDNPELVLERLVAEGSAG